MVEKLNTNECISRVYQFLSDYNKGGDWKTDADTSGDGTVISTEFHNFMLKYESEWNGESKYDSEDIIHKFWNAINTNTTGSANTKGTSNKIALDQKEIANMERTLDVADAVGKLIGTTGFEVPSGVDSDRWIASMKASLLNSAKGFNGDIFTDENKTQVTQEFIDFIKPKFASAKNKTTADCFKDQLLDQIFNSSPCNKYFNENTEYSYLKDSNLMRVLESYIKKYIGSLAEGESVDVNQIKSDIECLIKDYISKAGIGSGGAPGTSPAFTGKTTVDERLSAYGYTPNDRNFNDLQLQVLNTDLTDKIVEKINASNDYKNIYADAAKKAIIDGQIKTYCETTISQNKSLGFTALKGNLDTYATTFLDTNMKTIKAEIDALIKALQDAKDSLIKDVVDNYLDISDKYADKRKAVVKEVFGTDDGENVKGIINGKQTIEEVQDLRSAFEAAKAKTDAEISELRAATSQTDACGELAGLIDGIVNNNLTSLTGGLSSIHTEFGIDTNGDIIFEQTQTTSLYSMMRRKLKTALEEQNKEAYDKLGESNIDRLIQAAWIMTYNDFNSSQSNNCSEFIKKMLNNLKAIMKTIEKNPEYLEIYTGHTAYFNSSITDNIPHYGLNDTYGNDQIINYEDGTTIASDGTVNLANTTDNPDYQDTMDGLLKELKKKYSKVDPAVITKVFRDAQVKAIATCVANRNDCPYGTTKRVDLDGRDARSLTIANPTANSDWAGLSREGDRSRITMKTLVQITLYYFDKLLYAELAK